MKKFNPLAIAVCGYLLAGCASVPMTSASLDSEAKQFTPKPGMASIYVCRTSAGGVLKFQTMLDGRPVGGLVSNTYQMLSVPPGKHTVYASSEENVQHHKVMAEAGKNYFFKISVTMGWGSGRALLEPVTEEEGQKLVLSSKRAETTTYP
jgi:hypothetical protein